MTRISTRRWAVGAITLLAALLLALNALLVNTPAGADDASPPADPGKSDTAPGRTGDTPANDNANGGNSDEAPGHGGDNPGQGDAGDDDDGDASEAGKVWVCKYVQNPNGDPVLAPGKNPIHVSGNAAAALQAFSDAHPSFVVASGDADCSQPDGGNDGGGDGTCPDGSDMPASGVCDDDDTCPDGSDMPASGVCDDGGNDGGDGDTCPDGSPQPPTGNCGQGGGGDGPDEAPVDDPAELDEPVENPDEVSVLPDSRERPPTPTVDPPAPDPNPPADDPAPRAQDETEVLGVAIDRLPETGMTNTQLFLLAVLLMGLGSTALLSTAPAPQRRH